MQLPDTNIDGYRPFPESRAQEYINKGYWNNETFHEVLDRQVAEHPDRTVVIGPHRDISYETLAENSRCIATFLHQQLGLEQQDRIVVQLPNCVEFLELFFACSRIGVIPVMVLPRHREAEARHIVEHTDAKAYVTSGKRYDLGFNYIDLVENFAADFEELDYQIAVTDDKESLPEGWHRFEQLRTTSANKATETVDVNPSNPGLMLLSGGTTGLPKGIPRTYNDYIFQWEKMAQVVGVEEDWVAYPSIPMAHNASLCCVVGSAIWTGATVAIEPILKPESLMELIDRVGGSYSLKVPTQLIDILEHPDLDNYDLSSLEVTISGGQNVPPRAVYEFVDNWGVGFCNIFGVTEGPLICTRPDDDVETQAHTVGQPIAPEADGIRIVDQSRETEVDRGTPGELSVRGPGYFTGYFRNAKENEENFDDDGWFYTEDIISLNENGNYHVHGRIKDTIIRGGENIYAPDLEDVIIEHHKVENVAVIGMSDERLGERPGAFIELRDNEAELTLTELREFLDERGIAVFKHLEWLELVDSLPRTEIGKIKKTALKERLEER